MKRGWIAGGVLAVAILAVGTVVVFEYGRWLWEPAYRRVSGYRTVADAVAAYGPAATARLIPFFEKAGAAYPPREVIILATKREKRLELWARGDGKLTFIRAYVVRAASGVSGPKLREGDRQVPEGIYRVIGLNPNSGFHLSMKLDYPNAFDLSHARREGRSQPGTNIFIHGKASSIGCLAMGDPAIEELFVLTAAVGASSVKVVIAPRDPRTKPLDSKAKGLPPWTRELYAAITSEFRGHPLPAK